MAMQHTDTRMLDGCCSDVANVQSYMFRLQSEVNTLHRQVSELKTSMEDILGGSGPSGQQLQTRQETQGQGACMITSGSDVEDEEKEFHRHCMSKALQLHMVAINERIPYNSEIPHLLISSENLNDSEQETITNKKKNSASKMRSLVTLIRHRSLDAMTALINTFPKHNQKLFDSIWSTFESLKSTERIHFNKKCTACLLMDGVCLCDVVDHLDENDLLLPKVQMKIAESDAEFVDEKPLWHLLFQSFPEKDCRKAMEVMLQALEKKGPFCDYIARSLRKDIRDDRNAFRCVCQTYFQKRKLQLKRQYEAMSTSSDDSPKSSSSDCAMKTDTAKRRRRRSMSTTAISNSLQQRFTTTNSPRHVLVRRNASVAASMFSFRTRRTDRANYSNPNLLRGRNSRLADKSPQALTERKQALTQWRKLKIIIFFLTKLLVKLSKPNSLF